MIPRPPTLWRGGICVLALAGCGIEPGSSGPAWRWGGEPVALVLTVSNDFSAGAFGVLDLASRNPVSDLGWAGTDAVVRVIDGALYLIHRSGDPLEADSVRRLDPADGFRTLWQTSTDPGSNPQDIAGSADGSLLVSRYASAELLRLDPATGERLGTVDISLCADKDGVPEASALASTADGRVLVACQRLDRAADLGPTERSELCIVDADGGVTARPLAGTNPFTRFVPDPAAGGWLLGMAGSTLETEGGAGVERVGPDGNSLGLVAREEDLGGSVLRLALSRDGSVGWAIVNVSVDPANLVTYTHLVTFDVASGQRTRTVLEPESYVLWDVAIGPSDEVLVSDRHFDAPGLRVFDANSAEELTEAPIDMGLPPSEISFLP